MLSAVFGTDIALLVSGTIFAFCGVGFLVSVTGLSITGTTLSVAFFDCPLFVVTAFEGLTLALPEFLLPPRLPLEDVAIEGVAIGLLGLITRS